MQLESCIIPNHSSISVILRLTKCKPGAVEGGFMPECYATMSWYQFEYDKLLYTGI